MGIERPSLAWLLDQRAELDFIERREDPADKRGKTVHLTRKAALRPGRFNRCLNKSVLNFLPPSIVPICTPLCAHWKRSARDTRHPPDEVPDAYA
jgi:hypothetical protein